MPDCFKINWDKVTKLTREGFECPKCGSRRWGTWIERNIGCCNGEFFKYDHEKYKWNTIPCDFTWNRDEDQTVWVKVIKIVPHGSLHKEI